MKKKSQMFLFVGSKWKRDNAADGEGPKDCEDKNYFSLNKCDATTSICMPTLCTVLSPIPWNYCVRWK
jgi:hypothetical protein